MKHLFRGTQDMGFRPLGKGAVSLGHPRLLPVQIRLGQPFQSGFPVGFAPAGGIFQNMPGPDEFADRERRRKRLHTFPL